MTRDAALTVAVPPELDHPAPRAREALGVCAECAESLLINSDGERVRVCRARSVSGTSLFTPRALSTTRRLVPPAGGVAEPACFHCGCRLGDPLPPVLLCAQSDSDATASTADTIDLSSDEEGAFVVAGTLAERFVDLCERERGLRELVLGYLDPVSVVRLSMSCRELAGALCGRTLNLLLLERARWFGRADVAKLLVSRQIRRRWLVDGIALDCRGASLVEFFDVALAPMALRALSLRGCGNTGLQGLGACKWLLRLDLSFDDALTDLGPIGALRDLTHLRLEGCEALRSLEPLARCTELRALVLTGCRNVRSLRPLALCAKLTELDVALCFSLFAAASAPTAASARAANDGAEVGDEAGDAELSLLRGLRRLSLQGCSQLVRCPPLPPQLEELDMSSCEQLLDMGGVRGCRLSLRRANFSSCDALATAEALRACAALEAVDLSNCYNLLSVRPLSGCARLQSAQLGGCIRLTRAALGGCKSLETLNMTGCTALADVSDLARCAALEHLDVPFCTALRSVQPLVACARLRFLNLTRCDGISDVSCVTRMRSLRQLQIRWCPNISLDAIAAMPAALQVTYA